MLLPAAPQDWLPAGHLARLKIAAHCTRDAVAPWP